MKYEWRRQEKQLYGAKTTPVLVTVPTQSCIMINGEGNPNDTDFSNRVSSLYSVAYAVKMAYKKTAKGEYDDFAVYPLDRKSTRLNSSHSGESRMPSSA